MSFLETDDSIDAIVRRYYRWWTVKAWKWGVKLGPVSITAYRWFGSRWRVSFAVWCGTERVFLGPRS